LERQSQVKFHHCSRKALLSRRTLVRVPDATSRYVHRSGEFTGMMSDQALEGIVTYAKIMDNLAGSLRKMSRSGCIDPEIMTMMGELVSTGSEKFGACNTLLRNSLVRFSHTDLEPIIRPRMPGRRRAKKRSRGSWQAAHKRIPVPAGSLRAGASEVEVHG